MSYNNEAQQINTPGKVQPRQTPQPPNAKKHHDAEKRLADAAGLQQKHQRNERQDHQKRTGRCTAGPAHQKGGQGNQQRKLGSWI